MHRKLQEIYRIKAEVEAKSELLKEEIPNPLTPAEMEQFKEVGKNIVNGDLSYKLFGI